jgi:hypothetical protein
MPKDLANKEVMDPEAAPVNENPGLPAMEETPAAPSRVRQKPSVMAKDPEPDKGGKNRMPTPPKSKRKAKPGEQLADKSSRRPAESYLRLRVRVNEGEMSVQEVSEVEGPLIEPDTLNSGFVYEVTLAAQRLAVGGIPDLGVRRSYPAPDGTGELRGHHISVAPVAEFNVRVPHGKLSLSSLPRTEIALYRVKEDSPETAIRSGPLPEQFGRQLREVARLKGIHIDRLPQAIQGRLRRAFR